MSITLRPANGGDSEVLVEYNRRLALETEHKTLDVTILRRGVAAVLSDATRGLYFVAEQQGEVIGQVMVTTEWSDWRDGWMWWLQSVYVRADQRRHGVFRALWQHVYQQALARGDVASVRLYVERDNQRAQATYQSLGMADAGYLVMECNVTPP